LKLHDQFHRPTGILGHLVGWIMSTSNRERNQKTIELLELVPTDRVLEIGYGPGLAIASAAPRISAGVIVGIDHSTVMFAQARRRNAAAIRAGRVDLRLGGLELLPTLGPPFDKAFAVNAFGTQDEADRGVSAIKGVLRPGGLVAVTVSHGHGPSPVDPGADAMRAALERASFSDVRSVRLGVGAEASVCVLGIA